MSDYILPEVVSEILKRLPVKSLLRFRCVCTDWCSLISSPNFISQHLSHSSSSPSTLVRRYSKLHSKEFYTLYNNDTFDVENCTRITFPFHGKSEFYFRIVGVCNGLLCLSDDLFGYNETIIVWNPSIKRAITLPTPRAVYGRSVSYMFALGFGFDSVSNDYKVVRVAYVKPDNQKGRTLPPKVEVLSLSSGIWRRVKNNVEYYITEHFWSQAVIHGAVHWVAYKLMGNFGDEKPFHVVVLKFDLHTEKFVEMCLPEELDASLPITVSATVVNGCFSVVKTDDHSNDVFNINIGDLNGRSKCAIWVMRDYGNVDSWTLLFNVGLETGLSRMVGFKGDDEVLFFGQSGELVSYDFKNKAITGTGICGGTKGSFFVEKYAESLVLLGMGKKVEKTEPDYEDEDETVEESELHRKMFTFSVIMSSVMP